MRPALRFSLFAVVAVLLTATAVWLARPDPAPPPGLFAAYAAPGFEVRAAPGPGFHYLEGNTRRRWAWSAGEATLLLQRRGPAQALRLRFDLQALSPRTVTVSYQGFILWRGQIETDKAAVDIPSFTPVTPEAAITLTNDEPADTKPDDGRQLAFALSDLVITPAE